MAAKSWMSWSIINYNWLHSCTHNEKAVASTFVLPRKEYNIHWVCIDECPLAGRKLFTPFYPFSCMNQHRSISQYVHPRKYVKLKYQNQWNPLCQVQKFPKRVNPTNHASSVADMQLHLVDWKGKGYYIRWSRHSGTGKITTSRLYFFCCYVKSEKWSLQVSFSQQRGLVIKCLRSYTYFLNLLSGGV